MDSEQQKINLEVSDIIVGIAPAAIRTVIGVTSSLGALQAATKDETEKINSKSLSNPKTFKDANFWFTKAMTQPRTTYEQHRFETAANNIEKWEKRKKEIEDEIKEKEEQLNEMQSKKDSNNQEEFVETKITSNIEEHEDNKEYGFKLNEDEEDNEEYEFQLKENEEDNESNDPVELLRAELDELYAEHYGLVLQISKARNETNELIERMDGDQENC